MKHNYSVLKQTAVIFMETLAGGRGGKNMRVLRIVHIHTRVCFPRVQPESPRDETNTLLVNHPTCARPTRAAHVGPENTP